MTNEIALCKATSTILKGYFLKRLGHSLKLLNLSPAVFQCKKQQYTKHALQLEIF